MVGQKRVSIIDSVYYVQRALSKYHIALTMEQMSHTASCTVESKDAVNSCVLLLLLDIC